MLRNIFSFLLFLLTSIAQSQHFSFSESEVLNSDKIKELITLNVDRERPNHYVLKINEISISDFQEEEGTEIDGFQKLILAQPNCLTKLQLIVLVQAVMMNI